MWQKLNSFRNQLRASYFLTFIPTLDTTAWYLQRKFDVLLSAGKQQTRTFPVEKPYSVFANSLLLQLALFISEKNKKCRRKL